MNDLGFGVEVALTRFAKTHGITYEEGDYAGSIADNERGKFGLIDGFPADCVCTGKSFVLWRNKLSVR